MSVLQEKGRETRDLGEDVLLWNAGCTAIVAALGDEGEEEDDDDRKQLAAQLLRPEGGNPEEPGAHRPTGAFHTPQKCLLLVPSPMCLFFFFRNIALNHLLFVWPLFLLA